MSYGFFITAKKQERKIDMECRSIEITGVGESNPNKINVYRIKSMGIFLIKAALNMDLISSKVTFHINCFEPKHFFLCSSNLF